MWVEFGIIEAAWTKDLERYVSSRLSKNATHFAHLYIDTTTVRNVLIAWARIQLIENAWVQKYLQLLTMTKYQFLP